MAGRRNTRRRLHERPEAAPPAPTPRFSSPECEQWLAEKVTAEFVVEKMVHPDVDTEFGISDSFNRLGWGILLRLPNEYYPQLVREFYANSEDKNDKNAVNFISMVKGRRIELTDAVLSELLDVEDNGPRINQSGKHILSDGGWSRYHRLNELGIKTVSIARGDKYNNSILAKNVPLRIRVLGYLCQFNICPSRSSRNELRNIDFYLADKMIQGFGVLSGIPLASLLIREMRSVIQKSRKEKSFVFPRILTLIFRAFNIDLRGEYMLSSSSADVFTVATLKRLEYRYIEGRWIHMKNPRVDYDRILPKGHTPPPRPQSTSADILGASSSSQAALQFPPPLPASPQPAPVDLTEVLARITALEQQNLLLWQEIALLRRPPPSTPSHQSTEPIPTEESSSDTEIL